MKSRFPLLLCCVIGAGLTALVLQTEGLRVVTSEGARRLNVARTPRTVPAVPLIDQDGAMVSLGDYRGRVVLVDFIYASCPLICGLLGDQFRELQELMRRRATGPTVSLLSISFDVTRDGPAELRSYAERFGAKAPGWRIAVPQASGLPVLLKSFGVVVIPDQAGGFIHNAAISVVDADGRLVRILDPDNPPTLLTRAVETVAR